MHNWDDVYSTVGSNNKTNAYQNTITDAINTFFPLKIARKKAQISPGSAEEF